ncbi:MAG TPA: Gfo/Idh/MocA family oxidoreductase [Ktedonobacteraceae bacterium]|nr:Gfo/Idh/MocA family oxidoreductase [Ktedonobacteraceae bacterium]
MQKRVINFGIIGCGLMGREFGSAVARWCHLLDLDFVPRVVGVCDSNPAMLDWFTDNFESIQIATSDYHELLNSGAIDAIYCAVPHNLHERLYVDIIQAGKHLLGEKPFGIDLAANERILAATLAHPEVLVRCSSEFPFYAGAQQLLRFINEERFGKIIEVRAGFLHSSDLDPNKPINWKRRVAINGEYGCMGDLGMHVFHIPLRAGWIPRNVRALLSNIVTERPGPGGVMEACETWDNALLACEVQGDAQHFPMLLETKRIAPGEMNTWYLRVIGTDFSAEFSTKFPKTLRTMPYTAGGAQAWHVQDLGSESAYTTITGGIFETGLSDSILQMWAAFCDELAHPNAMRQPFYCATPQETAQSHRIMTAALLSNREGQVVQLEG